MAGAQFGYGECRLTFVDGREGQVGWTHFEVFVEQEGFGVVF